MNFLLSQKQAAHISLLLVSMICFNLASSYDFFIVILLETTIDRRLGYYDNSSQ